MVPPQLLEMARTTDVGSLPRLLEMLVPTVLAPAEAAQASNGGGNPRLRAAFDEPASGRELPPRTRRRAVVVTDVPASGAAITKALTARGVECVTIAEPATGFTPAAEQLAAVARESGPVDAVVVALGGGDTPAAASPDAAGVATRARRARRDHRPDRHRRGLGPRGRRSRGGERAARPGRHRGGRDDGRGSQSGPSGHAALARRAPGDGRPGGRVRDQRGVRPRVGARPGRGARRLPGERRRHRRAVRRRARRRRRTGSACAAIPARRARSPSAVPTSPAGSTARCATWSAARTGSDTRSSDGGTDRTHRRRARPPLGSGARRLVPVPGRPAGARHGRHLGDVPPLRPAHLLLGVGELERREVRARRRRDRGPLGRGDRGAARSWPRRPGTRRHHRRHRARRPDRRHRAVARRADGVAAVPRHPADGRRIRRPARRRPARARRARPGVRAHGASRPARELGRRARRLGRAHRCRRARGLAAGRLARGVRAVEARDLGAGGAGRQRPLQAVGPGHAAPLDGRRRVGTVDRALPRVVRRRPVHVREQLPGRRDARHLRPALPGLRPRHRGSRRRRRATSSSPRTPSGSIAADDLGRAYGVQGGKCARCSTSDGLIGRNDSSRAGRQ